MRSDEGVPDVVYLDQFAGSLYLDVLEPGIVPIQLWHPAATPSDVDVNTYGGIGRKS